MSSIMVGEFIFRFVSIFFDLLSFAVLARILMSWVPSGGAPQLRSILRDITEPILGPFRRVIPRIGMIDISPIVAIFALDIAKTIILQLLLPLVSVL